MNRSDSNRILLVDDDPQVHEQFRAILLGGLREEGSPGTGVPRARSFPESLQIESAYDGRQAWACVRQALDEYRPYMLAAVDFEMPAGWNGIETIQRIWDIDPELLVLLCVDDPGAEVERIVAQLGGLERLWMIAKPFGPTCLRQCVAWQIQHLQLREELHQTTLQLESAEQTIKRLHEEAEPWGRLPGEAIGRLKYDLRALLHGLLGVSDLLSKEPLGADELRRLRYLHEAGESLLDRVDEMWGRWEPKLGAAADDDPVGPETPSPADPGPALPPAQALPPSGARYLIVDDEAICCELLVEMLQPYGWCDVARDGEGAVEAFRRAQEEGRPYDLVCLDIMMPGLNGHEVLDRIRALETEWGLYGPARVKVIMTTALADSKHLLQALRSGCEAYVVKPFSENDLLTTMRLLDVAAVGAP